MSLRFIFNEYSHLRLGVPNIPFLCRFSFKILYSTFFPRTSRPALHVCLVSHKGKMVLCVNKRIVGLPFAEPPPQPCCTDTLPGFYCILYLKLQRILFGIFFTKLCIRHSSILSCNIGILPSNSRRFVSANTFRIVHSDLPHIRVARPRRLSSTAMLL